MTSPISRRIFIASLAVTAFIPKITVPKNAPISSPISEPTTDYGFTFDQYVYETGFPTREAALTAAQAMRPDVTRFWSGKIEYYRLSIPDIAEDFTNGLYNNMYYGEILIEALINENKNGDFEGEFTYACHIANSTDLGVGSRQALAAAAHRLDAVDLERFVLASDEPPAAALIDPVADALCCDSILESDLKKILQNWVDTNHLENDLRGLMINDQEIHTVPHTSRTVEGRIIATMNERIGTRNHLASTIARWLLQDSVHDEQVLFGGIHSNSVTLSTIPEIQFTSSPGQAARTAENLGAIDGSTTPYVLVAITCSHTTGTSFGDFAMSIPMEDIKIPLFLSGDNRSSDQSTFLLGMVSSEQARHLETSLSEAGFPRGRAFLDHISEIFADFRPCPVLTDEADIYRPPSP